MSDKKRGGVKRRIWRVMKPVLVAVVLAAVVYRIRFSPTPAFEHRIYVPASAHLAGASGTRWRTDLEVYNHGQSSVTYSLALLLRNPRKDRHQQIPHWAAGIEPWLLGGDYAHIALIEFQKRLDVSHHGTTKSI